MTLFFRGVVMLWLLTFAVWLVFLAKWLVKRNDSKNVLREAKGLLEALEMEGENSQEVFTWSNGLREAIRKVEEK